MRNVALVSCGSKKLGYPAKARDLYVGQYYRSCLAYAEKIAPNDNYILSAKFGLLEPGRVISPYDVTLKNMNKDERIKWGSKVLSQITKKYDTKKVCFVFLCGQHYWEILINNLEHFKLPLKGKSIGKQIQFLLRKTR